MKQDSWTESVAKSIEEAGSKITPQIKGYLEKLLSFDNIPRKQKPFGNFVKNSLKIWDDRKIDEIWQVISAAGTKMREDAAAAAAAAKAPAAASAPAVAAKEASAKNGQFGWKRALDSELETAGGELPWKRLRDALVSRYHRDSKESNGVSEDALGFAALAAIPDAYLSQKDNLVRLPKA